LLWLFICILVFGYFPETCLVNLVLVLVLVLVLGAELGLWIMFSGERTLPVIRALSAGGIWQHRLKVGLKD
jgi:hypothetical protein